MKRNRFDWRCPKCKIGKNSKEQGGNAKCFHCDSCSYIECGEDV